MLEDLATHIKKAQDPEISTMSGWLKTWGEKVPAGDMHGLEGMDHSGHPMPGMMSDADMKKLKRLSGSAFDTAFLPMMIEHHNGAIDQAQTEHDKGAYGPAKDFAGSIIDSQSAETEQMKKMLGKWRAGGSAASATLGLDRQASASGRRRGRAERSRHPCRGIEGYLTHQTVYIPSQGTMRSVVSTRQE